MPEFIRSKTVTARKVHRCRICFADAVQPGETYTRDTYVHDGTVYDWVSCEACRSISNAVYDWCSDADEGIGAETYDEWATEHRDDSTHGAAATAYLERRAAAALATVGDTA